MLLRLCLVLAVGSGVAAAESSRGFSYAYLRDGGSITMSGDSRDIEHVRSFKQGGTPVLWFRDGGQEYLVRDAGTLAALETVWKPGRELDAAEEALDRQSDGLDHKQDQLDGQREALDTRQEALDERESELADRESDDASAATRADVAKQRRELQQQRQVIAGERRKLDAPSRELRAQLEVIRRQLDVLHQKQKLASAKEDVEMRALLRRAVASGTAKPAK